MVKEQSLKYFSEIKSVLDSLDISAIEKVVDLLYSTYSNGNYIFIMGNGGSASAASHFACDINKGVSHPFLKKYRVISLSDNIPLITAYANDISYEDVFIEQMKNYLEPGALVIGISGSGNSRNILKAIDYANENSAVTVGLTGFDGGVLAKKVSVNVNVGINDMQKCEDVHLMLIHLIMQVMQSKLRQKDFSLAVSDETFSVKAVSPLRQTGR